MASPSSVKEQKQYRWRLGSQLVGREWWGREKGRAREHRSQEREREAQDPQDGDLNVFPVVNERISSL